MRFQTMLRRSNRIWNNKDKLTSATQDDVESLQVLRAAEHARQGRASEKSNGNDPGIGKNRGNDDDARRNGPGSPDTSIPAAPASDAPDTPAPPIPPPTTTTSSQALSTTIVSSSTEVTSTILVTDTVTSTTQVAQVTSSSIASQTTARSHEAPSNTTESPGAQSTSVLTPDSTTSAPSTSSTTGSALLVADPEPQTTQSVQPISETRVAASAGLSSVEKAATAVAAVSLLVVILGGIWLFSKRFHVRSTSRASATPRSRSILLSRLSRKFIKLLARTEGQTSSSRESWHAGTQKNTNDEPEKGCIHEKSGQPGEDEHARLQQSYTNFSRRDLGSTGPRAPLDR